MVRGGSAASAKGKGFERDFARSAGGKRTPGSGASGGGDVSFAPGTLWHDWGWELKRRARLPALMEAALEQARSDIAIGDPRNPAAAFRSDGGRIIVAFYWDDLRLWVEALAEVGQSGRIRRLAEQVELAAREMRRLAR